MDPVKYRRKLVKLGTVDKLWSDFRQVQNHTFPLVIRELKPVYKPCTFNCGQEVSNQHTEYKRILDPNIRWLQKCMSCGLYQDPITKEMVDHRNLSRYFPSRRTQF